MDRLDVIIVASRDKLEDLFAVKWVAFRYLPVLISDLSRFLFEVVDSFLLVQSLLDPQVVHLDGSGKLISPLLFL